MLLAAFGCNTLPLFSLGEINTLENALRESGLTNITIQPVSFSRHYSSTSEMNRRLKEAAVLRTPFEKLEEAERRRGRSVNYASLGVLESLPTDKNHSPLSRLSNRELLI